ncbi:diguanylate cyclase domain-containing protein [Angustibacter aerolatus]
MQVVDDVRVTPPSRHELTLRAMHAVATRVHHSLDLATTLQAVAQGVVEASGFSVAALNVVDDAGDFEVVCVVGDDDASAMLLGHHEPAAAIDAMLALAEPWGQLHFLHHSVNNGVQLLEWVPDLPVVDDPQAWHPDDSLFAVLTTPAGERVGMLSVDVPEDGRLPDAEQLEVLELFAQHAAVAIAHARVFAQLEAARRELEHRSNHDELTGLGNRRALRDGARRLTEAGDTVVGVVVLDLDRFKCVNDTAGHLAGDQVLQAVAARMAACVRDGDVLARTGGDEFVVAVAGDDVPDLLPRLAERLAAAIGQPIDTANGRHQVGASIGLALARTPVDLDALVRLADDDMYRRKRAEA